MSGAGDPAEEQASTERVARTVSEWLVARAIRFGKLSTADPSDRYLLKAEANRDAAEELRALGDAPLPGAPAPRPYGWVRLLSEQAEGSRTASGCYEFRRGGRRPPDDDPAAPWRALYAQAPPAAPERVLHEFKLGPLGPLGLTGLSVSGAEPPPPHTVAQWLDRKADESAFYQPNVLAPEVLRSLAEEVRRLGDVPMPGRPVEPTCWIARDAMDDAVLQLPACGYKPPTTPSAGIRWEPVYAAAPLPSIYFGQRALEQREREADATKDAEQIASRLAALAVENADLKTSIRLYQGNAAAAILEVVALKRELREARAALQVAPVESAESVDGIRVGVSAPLSIECVLIALEILRERRRQVEVEKFTPEHDALHRRGELAAAAACYAGAAGADLARGCPSLERDRAPSNWPWDAEWWKPKGPRRDLVRAGALILAQLEQMMRAASADVPP